MARGWKLMDDQKAAIEAVHDTGVPYTALAVQYGVSVATILRVCRQDTYERQKTANRRYQAANIKKITETRKVTHQNYRLSFHANSDSEVIERLNSQENVTDYIRQLVLRDIKTDDVKNEVSTIPDTNILCWRCNHTGAQNQQKGYFPRSVRNCGVGGSRACFGAVCIEARGGREETGTQPPAYSHRRGESGAGAYPR